MLKSLMILNAVTCWCLFNTDSNVECTDANVCT